MARKTEQETIEKLKKLSAVINSKEKDKKEAKDTPKKETKPENAAEKNTKKALTKTSDSKKENKKAKKSNKTFRTNEVVILMLITISVSLVLGGVFASRMFGQSGHKVESELQEFINDYQYIINNYNGEIDKKELFDAALQGMLSQLDDNSMFLSKNAAKNFNINLEGSYQGFGLEVYKDEKGIVISRVFDGSAAAKKGLKAGDIITAYNDKSVDKMDVDEFADKVIKDKDKSVKLTYKRDGKETTVKLKVSQVNLKSVASTIYAKENKKIGYIQIGIFANNTSEQFKEELAKLKEEKIDSLIIDVRYNSGGYLATAEKILSMFLDSSHPIYQIQKGDLKTKHYSKGKKDETVKIAILVNNSSASASEVLTSALSEQYKAIVVGEKTYGKGTVQEMQDLTDGNQYKITTKNWLTSKGKWINEKGIEPDIKVSLSKEYAENPTEENDNQLQTAINELIK